MKSQIDERMNSTLVDPAGQSKAAAKLNHVGFSEPKPFQITVLYTGFLETARALEEAGDLARGLNASLCLLVPLVVPYPLPLDNPAVPREFSERNFQQLAAMQSIETRVAIRLCRDRAEMLEQTLQPGSVIVMAGRSRWWPTQEQRLASRLSRLGHKVIFAAARRKDLAYA